MNFFNIFKKKTEKRHFSNTEIDTPGVGLLSGIFSNTNPENLSAVFAAIELITNSLAELPIYVKTKNEGKTQIVDDHAAINVLYHGNIPKFILIKNMLTDMLKYGDGLAYIERDTKGKPKSLHYCPHGTYTIYRVSDIIGKEKTVYKINNLPKQKNVEDINVIHFYKNTENGYSGKGLLQYASKTLKLAGYADKSASNFYANGCMLGGILSTDMPKLSNDTKQAIRDAWRSAHGTEDAAGIAVLEAGMHYQPVTTNSRDAQLLESRLYSLQEIARYFNISPVLLGDLSKSSYSSIEAANLEFSTHTLLPYITLIENELQRKLIMPNEKSLYIDVDENYLIRTDKVSMANYLHTLVASGIISVNEARQKLGMNAMEGGDKLFIPFTDISQNTISNENEDKNTEEEDE